MSEEIKEMTKEEVSQLLKSENKGKYEPIGKFYLKDGDKFVGIDNSTGDAWFEEFDDIKPLNIWLNSEMTAEDAIAAVIVEEQENTMVEVTRYNCKFCKKDFRTPDKHYCKMNPALKNCFTCKHMKGWLNGEDHEPNYPECAARPIEGEWDIEIIKDSRYNMQCEKWEEGKYDWSKEFEEAGEGLWGLW